MKEGITIFGIPAQRMLNRKIRITTRGHVAQVVYGRVEDVSEYAIVVRTEDSEVVIPLSQIKVIELGRRVPTAKEEGSGEQ